MLSYVLSATSYDEADGKTLLVPGIIIVLADSDAMAGFCYLVDGLFFLPY